MPPIGIGHDGELVRLPSLAMAEAHADLRCTICLSNAVIDARHAVARSFRAGRDENQRLFDAAQRDYFLAQHDARMALAWAATDAALADLRRAAR